jgi:hypothetical protein
VPPLKAILVALGSLGLAGCATHTASTGPAPARIVLAPSDEAFQEAIKSLSPAERAVIKKGMGFTVDTLVVKPTPVETMPWSRRRPETPSDVNIADFVRFLDRQPALKGPVRVNLSTARVLSGLTFDQEASDPVFRIQMEIVIPSATFVSVTGFGAGPVCKRHDDGSQPTQAEISKSAQVAFMKAILKTLLKINDQVLQS